MIHQSFNKHRSSSILPRLFKVGHGAEERLVQACDGFQRVIVREENLSGGIRVGRIGGVGLRARVVLSGDPTTLQIPEGIINAWPANGQGKVRCTIHSYSGAAADSERPFYLNTSYSMPNHKWCDTSEGDSWVVFEFTDVYSIRRLVFRDVQGHESNCGNVPEYTVLTSMDGKQWTEVAHKTGVENEATKDVSFTDTEARYVKLVLKKGTRGDGRKDNAVRIYGVDIYGEMAAQADHAGVVSIGKTLLKGSDAMNERETAANLLDGNHTDKNTKWCFAKGNADTHPYNFAIIDLEDEYMVSGFHLYDCHCFIPVIPE